MVVLGSMEMVAACRAARAGAVLLLVTSESTATLDEATDIAVLSSFDRSAPAFNFDDLKPALLSVADEKVLRAKESARIAREIRRHAPRPAPARVAGLDIRRHLPRRT